MDKKIILMCVLIGLAVIAVLSVDPTVQELNSENSDSESDVDISSMSMIQPLKGPSFESSGISDDESGGSK